MKRLFVLLLVPFAAPVYAYRHYLPANVRKLLGITLFLLIVYGAMLSDPSARTLSSHQQLGQRIGLYGILSLAAGMLIITGGIDLSMGSFFVLSATLMAFLVRNQQWPLALAFLAVLPLGVVVGLIHGTIVTRLRVQAFVVTLCGLFIFRSLARWVTKDQPVGLGTSYPEVKAFFNGTLAGVPVYLLVLLGLAFIFHVFLHLSVHGRYFFALGSNERAAEYSGIATQRYRVLAFVLCSTLVVVYGFLQLMRSNSVTPSSDGTNLELMAIAAAVLGGCTLRGGEGTIYGMLAGTAILQCLQKTINVAIKDDTLEGLIIGSILLLGTVFDEVLRTGKLRAMVGRLRGSFAARAASAPERRQSVEDA